MSAVTKPLVNFTSSQKPNIFIPVESVLSVEAQDIAAQPNAPGSTASYLLVFTLLDTNNVVRYEKVPFATSGARNTSLTNFKSTFVTAVA